MALQNMRDQLNNQYAQHMLANPGFTQGEEDGEDAYGQEADDYGSQVIDIDNLDPDLLAQAQLYQQ